MSDHVNILANRMRSATSAAKRKILMQQAEAMISMASDPLEAARERASKAVSLYDDADAALEKAAKEYQQAKKAAEDARVAASRELSQAMHTRDGSRPITSAEVNKLVSAADKRLKSFDDRVAQAEQAYQQARKDYDAAAAAKQKAQAEFAVAKVQARSGKMQADAMTFAAIATVLVTNQQYDASLPWSESVKPRMAKIPKRSFLEGREYSPRNQQELDLLLEVYGQGIRVTKSMQADVSMALEQPNAEEIAYRTAQAQRQKAVDKVIQAAAELQKTAAGIARFLKLDDVHTAMNYVKAVGQHADILERLINRIQD